MNYYDIELIDIRMHKIFNFCHSSETDAKIPICLASNISTLMETSINFAI